MSTLDRLFDKYTIPGTIIGIAALGLLIIVPTIMMITGFYSVGPGEAAALRTFGKARAEPESQEGLHWHWPSPIGRTDVVQVRKSRTATVGYHELPDERLDAETGQGWTRDLHGATMITGDLNIVEVQIVAQYTIKDLNKYLFGADDPGVEFTWQDQELENRSHRSHQEGKPDGSTIRNAISIAVRESMGLRNIDEALIQDRETIEQETRRQTQFLLDEWQTGLQVNAMQLQEVKAPQLVQDAFDDVLRAREERDTRINQALTYESRVLPEARGEAEQIRKEAVAYASQRVNQAQGEADRYNAILVEYQQAPDITATRMWLNMFDDIGERLDFVINETEAVLILGSDSMTKKIVPLTPSP